MANEAIRAVPDPADMAGLQRAVRRMAKMVDAAPDVVEAVASRLSAAARGAGGTYPDVRARAVAGTLDALADRSGAAITLGGAGAAGVSGGASYSDLAFGVEFGAVDAGPNGWRFPSYRARGRWLFPTVDSRANVEIDKELDDWGRKAAREWVK